ncbi:tryptophan--tRNA ligase [Candidatus Marinimicrobia bacterium]|nr:tryptophan--tRNA ligase [Candidatus Neomarinimicrobiota bacterium]MDA9735920.1 tryptophan--tRNA ligase [Candidatus Neomarinimicrobiota bacterium]
MKKRILSGVQPSGQLHIGNYFGMIERMIQFQNESELFCFVANYHSMTSINDKVKLEANTREAFIDLLALGIDPDQSTFWVQSHVPEVTELAWILSNFASVGLMQRSTSYKDKIANGLKPNMGLFSYPILMASDILLFQSEIVPVGKDQKQHLEMTRDIAIKFNNSFGEIFTIPEIEIDKSNDIVIGIDNQKMSKSYKNTIPIFADNDTIKDQVMNIVTDSAGLNEPKDKHTPLFKIYSLFLNDESKKELADRYDTPGLKYMEIKNELIETIISFFELQRSKREQLLANPDEVNQKMILGQNKAKKIAQKTLQEVKSATGLL